MERISDILRYSLRASTAGSVALSREIDMVRDYLDVQRARFGERLVATVDVEPGTERLEVPPFLLFPLVENAVLHGAGDRHGVTVSVRVMTRAGTLLLEVRDDGPGPKASRHKGSETSLDGLRKRLALTHGPAAQFSLVSGPKGGAVATVEVPL